MKTPNKASRKVLNLDELDRVVANAKTVTTGADVAPTLARRQRVKPERKQRKGKGNPPPGGYTRATFDLPTEFHDRFKLVAVQRKRPMRDLVEEALRAYLKDL